MCRFSFIDEVSEVKKNESLTAFYTLKETEEFLKDHFGGFPVMPGVLLLESLKEAAIALLLSMDKPPSKYFRLNGADEVKFGQFVRPENKLKVFVRLLKAEGSLYSFDGRIDLVDASTRGKALSANLSLVPM